MAVQMTSSMVLPWIGGPSSSSWPGRMRNFHTEKRTTTSTSTKIGTEAMIRTSNRVSMSSACVEATLGNQLMDSATAMPIADAMAPMTNICAS